MINKDVCVGKSRFGKGLFAKNDIKKDGVVLVFEGKARSLEDFRFISKYDENHSVQIGNNKWLVISDDSKFINHSCNPNCGIRGTIKIVAMVNIRKGEELTFDYAMSEDSEWSMKCRCGSKGCRKIIKGYSFLPAKIKQKYRGYISGWLDKKS
ncbi:MAG: SET domain-containing protein-lysine N-methyltransferase [Candidatus Aenigmarchaeota archaeon]|nr:SET domain-containing protein-lysine N-methyltransferase [Candidatus Aenigmarchaeota archaeon]